MANFSLILQILLIVVCIDHVTVDFGECNNKSEEKIIPPLVFPVFLQWCGVHIVAIVIVGAISKFIVIVTNLRILF